MVVCMCKYELNNNEADSILWWLVKTPVSASTSQNAFYTVYTVCLCSLEPRLCVCVCVCLYLIQIQEEEKITHIAETVGSNSQAYWQSNNKKKGFITMFVMSTYLSWSRPTPHTRMLLIGWEWSRLRSSGSTRVNMRSWSTNSIPLPCKTINKDTLVLTTCSGQNLYSFFPDFLLVLAF